MNTAGSIKDREPAQAGHVPEDGFAEKTMLGMTGFAFSTAATLVAAFSPLLATEATSTPVMHGATHGVMFLCMAFFYFAVARFIKGRDALVCNRAAQTAFFALQALLPAAVLLEKAAGVTLPPFAIMLLWAAFGVASAYFSCAWTNAQSVIGEERIRKANLWSFCIAGCMATGVLAMPPLTGTVALLVLCAAAFALMTQAPRRPFEEMDERDEQWFEQNSRYSANGSYIMLVDGIMIGVIAGLLVARISKDVLPVPVMGLEFIGVACIFFLFDKKAPRLLDSGRSQLVLLPVLVCGLIAAGFLDAPWNTVSALPLFAFLYLFDYTNSSVLSLRGSLLSISPCYCFSKGRVFMVFGQAAGWFVGGLIASDFAHGALPVVCVFLIVLLCVYITVATVKPDKYPIVVEGASEEQAADSNMAPPPPPSKSSSARTSESAQRPPWPTTSPRVRARYCSTWRRGATPSTSPTSSTLPSAPSRRTRTTSTRKWASTPSRS